MTIPEVDLDDNTNCPVGDVCHACGDKSNLSVATFDTPVGVICMTVCDPCWRTGGVSRVHIHPITATHMVLAHCEHLDIDLDQAAALRGEQ